MTPEELLRRHLVCGRAKEMFTEKQFEQWFANMVVQENDLNTLNIILATENREEFLLNSFVWSNTPEGFEYWEEGSQEEKVNV